jgi:hypothetical protein
MDIKELKAALITKGWTEDRWGNLKREVETPNGLSKYRVKVQKISVRLEREYTVEAMAYAPAHKNWALITSSYLKDIKVREDGAIIVGRKVLK